jgi:hypothetical protein
METTQPEGFHVERGRLLRAGGAPVALGAAHRDGVHSIVVRDGRAVVVTSEAGCECQTTEASILRHAVSIVDLAAGTATSFETGGEAAAVALGDDGAVYLQVGEAGPGEPIGDGVLLTVPRGADGICCGL